MNFMKNEYKTIEAAINAIDYTAISSCMKLLDWRRAEIRSDRTVFDYSTAEELKETVLRLINKVNETPYPPFDETGCSTTWWETGGFKVAKTKYDDSESEYWKITFSISVTALIDKDLHDH